MRQFPEDFKINWEKNLNTCSENMMLMLIGAYNQNMEDLDVEIEDKSANIQSLTAHKHYLDKNAELRKYLNNLIQNLITDKNKKIARDRLQFKENRAYNWSIDSKPKGRGRHEYEQREAISDLTSNSISSSTSQSQNSLITDSTKSRK